CLQVAFQRVPESFLQEFRSNVLCPPGRSTGRRVMAGNRAHHRRFPRLSRRAAMVGDTETLARGNVCTLGGRDHRPRLPARSVCDVQARENYASNGVAATTGISAQRFIWPIFFARRSDRTAPESAVAARRLSSSPPALHGKAWRRRSALKAPENPGPARESDPGSDKADAPAKRSRGLRQNSAPLDPHRTQSPTTHYGSKASGAFPADFQKRKSARCRRCLACFRANCRPRRVDPTSKRWLAKATTAREMDGFAAIASEAPIDAVAATRCVAPGARPAAIRAATAFRPIRARLAPAKDKMRSRPPGAI